MQREHLPDLVPDALGLQDGPVGELSRHPIFDVLALLAVGQEESVDDH